MRSLTGCIEDLVNQFETKGYGLYPVTIKVKESELEAIRDIVKSRVDSDTKVASVTTKDGHFIQFVKVPAVRRIDRFLDRVEMFFEGTKKKKK